MKMLHAHWLENAGNYYKFQGVSIVFNVRPMIVHTESLHTAILHWCEWPDLQPINHSKAASPVTGFLLVPLNRGN